MRWPPRRRLAKAGARAMPTALTNRDSSASHCPQVYEGLTFKLSLKFPTSYPYEAPQVTFLTPCFHPNVDQYGNICLDILKVRFRPFAPRDVRLVPASGQLDQRMPLERAVEPLSRMARAIASSSRD